MELFVVDSIVKQSRAILVHADRCAWPLAQTVKGSLVKGVAAGDRSRAGRRRPHSFLESVGLVIPASLPWRAEIQVGRLLVISCYGL